MGVHKTEGIWLVLGTNLEVCTIAGLDAGLLVPYRGNNTQSTPPPGKLFY